MKDSERITQLEAIIRKMIPHFQMLVDQTSAQDLILYELVRLAPTHTTQALLDTLNKKAKEHSQSAQVYASAAEIVSIALTGETPKKNIRDLLQLIPAGKSDS